MIPAQTFDRARKFIAALQAFEQGDEIDATSLRALFAEDAVLTNSALDASGKVIRGLEDIGSFWSEYKEELERVSSEFYHVTVDDGVAGLFWKTSGTGGHGEPVHYHGATLLEFDEDGLITRFQGYFDPAQLRIRSRVPA
jgi:ketosteroid isomerase-like protein